MLTRIEAAGIKIEGVSVGGVYTCLHVPSMKLLLDVGIGPRSFAGVDNIFLSHAHADHIGSLPGLLGIRGMMQRPTPRLFMPAEVVDDALAALAALSRLQRFELAVEPIAMLPGTEHLVRADLWVRAFRTLHPVPSLGYQFFRRIKKLRPEFADLPGAEIGIRRKRGDDLFETIERLELAYATDTLALVLEREPELFHAKVLIIECSFLDERKSLKDTHAGCHIHLDELIELADKFENKAIVLMHFSQTYSPDQVRDILRKRLPPNLLKRVIPFAPKRQWPG